MVTGNARETVLPPLSARVLRIERRLGSGSFFGTRMRDFVMMESILAGFLIATGFVSAGILSSLYQLVTSEHARFDMSSDRLMAGVAHICLLMFAGPYILMRNAVRGRLIEGRPIGWLAASAAIAAAWSLCSGAVVMQFVMALGNQLS